jgi:hypothetical protein
MRTNHLKTGVEPTPETSCISNTPQTMDNVRHYVPFIQSSKLFKRYSVRISTELPAVLTQVNFSVSSLRAYAGILS